MLILRLLELLREPGSAIVSINETDCMQSSWIEKENALSGDSGATQQATRSYTTVAIYVSWRVAPDRDYLNKDWTSSSKYAQSIATARDI